MDNASHSPVTPGPYASGSQLNGGPLRTLELAGELRIDRQWTERKLDEMHARGLLSTEGGASARYRLSDGPSERAALLAQLARCYEERRVTIITLIYSRPRDHIQGFADAFRFREEK